MSLNEMEFKMALLIVTALLTTLPLIFILWFVGSGRTEYQNELRIAFKATYNQDLSFQYSSIVEKNKSEWLKSLL